MIFKIANALVALMFVISALLQLNDPDPVVWFCLYMLCAVCSVLAFTQINAWGFMLSLSMLTMMWAMVLFSDYFLNPDPVDWVEVFSATSMKSSQTEIIREIGGLLMCSAWTMFLVFRCKNNPKTT
ncbi:MAG: hypothetical protein COB62_06555 [Piscirickettsiaceae bacterium]|nr:MAG: hypothetical protein COB62_06555 [Piscirickettsiaceae bacterium]